MCFCCASGLYLSFLFLSHLHLSSKQSTSVPLLICVPFDDRLIISNRFCRASHSLSSAAWNFFPLPLELGFRSRRLFFPLLVVFPAERQLPVSSLSFPASLLRCVRSLPRTPELNLSSARLHNSHQGLWTWTLVDRRHGDGAPDLAFPVSCLR